MKIQPWNYRTLALGGCLLLGGLLLQAQDFRVQGRVTNLQGRGVQDVNVLDPFTLKQLDTTDEDGHFSVLVERDDSLKFSCLGYVDKTVKVLGRQQLPVLLEENVIELDEVMVVSKIRNKVVPEPTEIEVKGNYFYLKTRVPVPKEMFSGNRRLVIQPSIYDLTTRERRLLTPVVFDGKAYHTSQRRLYGYDLEQDPLHDYIRVKTTSSRKGDVIAYHDSLYIEDLQHSYRADVHLAMENYRSVIYRDSFSIAQGTVNPLRFLEYHFSAFPLTDERFLPKPVMQLRDTKGEVNLTFRVGKAELDDANPRNRQELDRLKAELQAIEHNPDASLKSFQITGVASPDGSYEQNLRLARLRTNAALDRILAQLDPDTRRYLEVKSDAEVAPWTDVVALLEQDSFPEVAREVKKVLDSASPARLHAALKARPFYKQLAADFLPRLRKVRYTYGYSVFRTLTDAEILDLYRRAPKELTRYEFYRLIAQTPEGPEKEQRCREALQQYDHFTYAANALSVSLLQRGEPDATLLEPFVEPKAPVELLSNHALALLDKGKYNRADSVMALIPADQVNPQLLAVSQALAGYYDEAYDVIAASSPLNEVLMLLALKRNAEAWTKLEAMKVSTAREYYVKAIAANRLDKVAEAIIYLEMALAQDPSLLEIAKVDSDVLDLLPDEQQNRP